MVDVTGMRGQGCGGSRVGDYRDAFELAEDEKVLVARDEEAGAEVEGAR